MPLGAPFWRLFVSSASSNLADGITRVALPLLAASLTRDPVAVSALSALAFLPWLLFALPAGALVDRVDRPRAMAAANIVRAAALAVLGVTALTGTASLVVLYLVAFGIGVAETVYDSAARAVLPQVVARDQLDRGNGLMTAGEEASQSFVGAPVGSLLFALAVAAPFLTTAGAYVLAALLVLGIAGTRVRRAAGAPATSMRGEMADGVRWLWRHRLLRGLAGIAATTCLLNSLTTGVLVLLALDTLRIGEAGFGLLLTASGVGAVLGGLTAAPLAGRIGRTATLVLGAVVAAATTLAIGLVANGFAVGALAAVGAAAVMFWNVITMSLRQALIPHELFGRVQGAYRTLVWGAIPVGAVLGGVLADATSVPTVFVVSGAGQLGMALLLWRLLIVHRARIGDAFRSEPEPTAAG
jgi:MFS family permease